MKTEIDAAFVSTDLRGFHVGQQVLPSRARTKELCEMLRTELGVPRDAKSFEVRFAGEDVTVKCEYMPRER